MSNNVCGQNFEEKNRSNYTKLEILRNAYDKIKEFSDKIEKNVY